LRKRLGKRASFRYVVVPEYGELRGRLHYHVLIHETSGVVLYRDICECWRDGFTQAKLVKCESTRGMTGVASYVSKYVAKALSHRVRASSFYGEAGTGSPGATKTPQGSGAGVRQKTPHTRLTRTRVSNAQS
jgi:hypothetical protein